MNLVPRASKCRTIVAGIAGSFLLILPTAGLQLNFFEFIYNEDYVKVDGDYAGARASRTAIYMQSVLDGCQYLNILDYGAGSGQFAKEMQNRGFVSVVNYDPFSSPRRPKGTFDLITCFEVVEHSPDPIGIFSEITHFLSDNGAVFIGQTLQPDDIKAIRGSWWYIAPRNGHVSTYSEVTFTYLASKFGLDYYRGVPCVFARTKLDDATRRAIEKIGRRVTGIELYAPSRARDSRWHEPEPFGFQSFRWTAADHLTWPNTSLGSGLNSIRIPFLMEISDGFAEKCRVFVDGSEAATKIEEKTILAEISLTDAGRHGIALRTPVPISPSALGTAPNDHRPLGLAMPVGPAD